MLTSLIKHIFFVMTIFVMFTSAGAQTVDFKFFEGSGAKVKSNINKYQKTYKQIRAEQKEYLQTKKKTYKSLSDSTSYEEDSVKNTLSRKARRALESQQREHFVYTDSLYSLEEIMSWDSLQTKGKKEALSYSKNILDGNAVYEKYQSQTQQLTSSFKELRQFKDSLNNTALDNYEKDYLIEKKKAELAEEYNTELESRLTKELQQRELIPAPFTSPELEQLQEFDGLASGLDPSAVPADVNTHGLENLKEGDVLDVAKTQGMDYFSGKEEVLDNGIESMQDLKKKYSSVPNSNDLSTATKSNSLKGKTWKQRLVIGGNFQIHIDKSVAIDLNPDIAFLINKDFSIGVGGNYRLNAETLGISSEVKQASTYGYRGYVEYKLFSSFYAHGEYENLMVTLPNPVTAEVDQSWNPSVLAGIEKRIKISDTVQGQISFLYNFMYKNNPAYNSPIVVRVGFNYIGLLDK